MEKQRKGRWRTGGSVSGQQGFLSTPVGQKSNRVTFLEGHYHSHMRNSLQNC